MIETITKNPVAIGAAFATLAASSELMPPATRNLLRSIATRLLAGESVDRIEISDAYGAYLMAVRLRTLWAFAIPVVLLLATSVFPSAFR